MRREVHLVEYFLGDFDDIEDYNNTDVKTDVSVGFDIYSSERTTTDLFPLLNLNSSNMLLLLLSGCS